MADGKDGRTITWNIAGFAVLIGAFAATIQPLTERVNSLEMVIREIQNDIKSMQSLPQQIEFVAKLQEQHDVWSKQLVADLNKIRDDLTAHANLPTHPVGMEYVVRVREQALIIEKIKDDLANLRIQLSQNKVFIESVK